MEFYTRKEVAKRLKIGLRTLDRRLAQGEIQCYRLGSGARAPVRISEAHVKEYLARHSSENIEQRANEILRRTR